MNIKTEINKKILELMYTSIIAESGDGDAIWLCKHTPLEEIKNMIQDFDKERNTGWSIVRESDLSFSWGREQEWAIITDSKDEFNGQAPWIILKINY